MVAIRRYAAVGWLLVLSLVNGCDGNPVDPVSPAPRADAAAHATAGPTMTAPSNANAIAVSTSRIDVSWKDNSTQETGFEVHRSTTGPGGAFTILTTTGAEATSYGNVGLTALTQYCYKMRAFRKTGSNTSYSAFSNTVCATTFGPPSAPSSTNVKPLSSSVVSVTWSDNAGTETGFRVERSATTAGPWTIAATTGANVNSTTDSGLASEHQVCYRVIAFNSYGDSGPSNTDCTTPPAAPSNLTATPVAQEIDLAWVDNSAVEDGYVVLRDMGYGTEMVADLPPNSTSYRDVPVGGGVTYIYYVRARKDGGFSDESDAASAQCADPECPAACSGSIDCGVGFICGPGNVCVLHCFDGVTDRDETDVDCGGNACDARCQIGQSCYIDSDCASNICGVDSTCLPSQGGQP